MPPRTIIDNSSASTPPDTLPGRIATAVAERITSGAYDPGDRLVEAALAREFGVSHAPVRDALRLLQTAGLVTIPPFRGAHVTELSAREVQEVFQFRAALVGLRARWLAEDPARAAVVAKVAEPISRLAALAESAETKDDYIATALAVSRTLTEGLSNRWLRGILEGLTLQTGRYTRLALESPERRKHSARMWRALLDAIERGDGDLAQALSVSLSLSTRAAAAASVERAETRGASAEDRTARGRLPRARRRPG